jgi:hypothetical protein
MRQLSTEDLSRLRAEVEPPCISLYQPTHRHHPENRQDPIRYRNLRSQMEKSLRQSYSPRDVRDLLKKHQSLQDDAEFWNHRTDGLAILSSTGCFELFDLQRPVREFLMVAQSFYTKPLLRILQSSDRYQVLCLGRDSVTLFEGNRDVLDPIDLGEVCDALTDALAAEDRSLPRPSVRSAPGGGAVHYNPAQKSEQMQNELEKFFRAVDRIVLERYSRPGSMPLLLAALTEHHAPFRNVSHNPMLMSEGIRLDPGSVDVDELRRLAWQKMEPVYLQRLAAHTDRYRQARADNLASDRLDDVVFAAMSGRVGTLLVEADRQHPGEIESSTGRIVAGDPSNPLVGDVLNDLADTVACMDGEVIVVPAERMPSSTGVAATYRF